MDDVLIVGAGPVGLSLALALGRAGHSVTIFEKEAKTREHSRAPVIWPRTQEILETLGVLDRFIEEGIVLSDVSIFDADHAKALLRIPFSDLKGQTRFPQVLLLPQNRTEEFLLEAVKKQPLIKVIFDAEVYSFTQSAESVQVQWHRRSSPVVSLSADAHFLIGCDGAHSGIRETLGIELTGVTYSNQAALADIRLDENKDFVFPRFTRREGVFCVAIKIESDLWRLIFIYPPGDSRSLQDRIHVGAKGLFPELKYQKVWQSEFHLHRRLATHFVKGRVALAGDAAHLNSPVGGQGMNAGIQDTAPLARYLSQAILENAPAHLLRYEAERRPAIRLGVNRFTDLLTRVIFFQNGRFIRPIFSLVNFLFRFPFFRRAFLRRAAMLTE